MAHLPKSPDNLVWIDLEMTGLSPVRDRVLEIAIVVTNSNLTVRVQGPVIAIHQSAETLAAIDTYNRAIHGKSGLLGHSAASKIDEHEAERRIISFLEDYVPAGKSPLCGNVVGKDRQFLAEHMSHLHDFFSYRDFDVSTLAKAAELWAPSHVKHGFKRKHAHGAAADVNEAIDMMIYYRRNLLR